MVVVAHQPHSPRSESEVVALVESIRSNIRGLAKRMARLHRWIQGYIDASDLESEGIAAAVRLARGYDSDRGTFWTYAVPRVRGAIVDAIRRGSDYSRVDVSKGRLGRAAISLDCGSIRVSNQPDWRDHCLSVETDRVGDCVDDYRYLADRVFPVWSDQRAVRIARMYFVERKTMLEISVELSVSESRICQMLSDLLAESRQYCKEQGIDSPGSAVE